MRLHYRAGLPNATATTAHNRPGDIICISHTGGPPLYTRPARHARAEYTDSVHSAVQFMQLFMSQAKAPDHPRLY